MLTIKIILIILFSYLGFYSFFWFVLTILGIGYKTKPAEKTSELPGILILLPAYRPGKIFSKVLEKVKALEAIHPNIRVYCLMQHAEKELIALARNYSFIVHEATFDQLPGNSYHHALKFLVGEIKTHPKLKGFDPVFTLILDKDNLIDIEFFNNIPNNYFQKYDVIQGRRAAILNGQSTSFFDQVSESLNDCMFRAASSRIGALPEVSGSAGLIRTDVFCKAINNLDPKAPGYDKNFMIQLLTTQSVKGIFVPEAFVSEEKTDNIESFQPQRLRWFGEQYFNALFSAGKLLKSWLQGSWSSLVYLIILWRPPRSIQLFLVPFFGLVEAIFYLINQEWLVGLPAMGISTIFVLLSVFVFLLSQRMMLQALKYGLKLPQLMLGNLISALNSIKRKNRGKFIHTEHKL